MMDMRRTHDAMLRDTPPKDSHTNHTCSSTPPAMYLSAIAWESAVQQHKPRVHDCMTACRRLRMLMMRVMTAPNGHGRKWRRGAWRKGPEVVVTPRAGAEAKEEPGGLQLWQPGESGVELLMLSTQALQLLGDICWMAVRCAQHHEPLLHCGK